MNVGHGVAITYLPYDFQLLLQCECGWRFKLGKVATVDYAAALVAEHRIRARPMRRWIRTLVVRTLRFGIRHRPAKVLQLRQGLEQAIRHRGAVEADLIWREACQGTWLEGN